MYTTVLKTVSWEFCSTKFSRLNFMGRCCVHEAGGKKRAQEEGKAAQQNEGRTREMLGSENGIVPCLQTLTYCGSWCPD